MGIGKSVIGGILYAISWWQLPMLSGTIHVTGLENEVHIHRDNWGVPHIRAKSVHDAMFAQGFITAQDRMWQLELRRRLSHGRAAELLGEALLPIDRMLRTIGITHAAKLNMESDTLEHRAEVQSFADGVNAWMQSEDFHRPLELLLVARDLPLEPWTALDSYAVQAFVSWQLSRGWDVEVSNYIMRKAVPSPAVRWVLEQFAAHEGPYNLPIVTQFPDHLDPDHHWRDGADSAREHAQAHADHEWSVATKLVLDAAVAHDSMAQQSGGSNAWTVTGKRSASGKPMLANDPHLPPGTPNHWLLMDVEVEGGLRVAGAALVGIPGVLVGHNRHAAWGLTVSLIDTEDLFVEEVVNTTHYRYKDADVAFDVRTEVIHVRGRSEPAEEVVRSTVHGPLVTPFFTLSESAQPVHAPNALAYCSMALRGEQQALGVDVARSTSVAELRATFARLEAPSLSVCLADDQGHIGFIATGRYPVRPGGMDRWKGHDGSSPIVGWTGKYDWTAVVGPDQQVYQVDPLKGYFAAANHMPIDHHSYRYHLGHNFCPSERGLQIARMIESQDTHDVASFVTMQSNWYCRPAHAFAKWMKSFNSTHEHIQEAADALAEWDGVMGVHSVPATLFELVRDRVLAMVMHALVSNTEKSEVILGKGVFTLFKRNERGAHKNVLFENVIVHANRTLWSSLSGTPHSMVERALDHSLAWLLNNVGDDRSAWEWGRLHYLAQSHPLSRVSPLLDALSAPSIPFGGNSDTVSQGSSAYGSLVTDAFSPSLRFVADTADWDATRAVLPAGQSGNMASPHFADQAPLFAAGETLPLYWSPDLVKQHTTNTLILTPSNADHVEL